MNVKNQLWLIPILVCTSLAAASDWTPPVKKRTEPSKPIAAKVDAPVPPGEGQPAARIVHYGEKDVIAIKFRFVCVEGFAGLT